MKTKKARGGRVGKGKRKRRKLVAAAVERYLHDFSIQAYDETTRRGLLRHIYVRTNHLGQALVCLVVNGKNLPHEQELVSRIRAACPDAVGVVLNTNTEETNVMAVRFPPFHAVASRFVIG